MWVAVTAWVVAAGAHAQPVWVADEYLLDRWTTSEGLPVIGTTAVRVSPSGYLWLTTFDGLVRFDGRRFTVFNASRYPGLPGNRLVTLLETPDGDLWTATTSYALARFDGIRFHPIGREHGLPHRQTLSQHLGADGSFWVGTRRGLARLEGESFRPWAREAIRGAVRSIYAAIDGRVWVGTEAEGLYELHGERVRRRYTTLDGLPSNRVLSLALDEAGSLWVGTASGVARLRDGSLERFAALDGEPVERIRVAPDGGVHVLTGERGHVWDGASWHPLRERQTSAFVEEILGVAPDGAVWTVDQEVLARDGRKVLEAPCVLNGLDFDATGAVWLATDCDGLWRVRRREVAAVTAAHGLPNGPVYGLAQTPDGTLWAASARGTVSAIRRGRVGAVHRVGIPGDRMRTLLTDADGHLWVGQTGLCVLRDGACRVPPEMPDPLRTAAVRALYEGAEGNIWIGTENGLWLHVVGRWRRMDDALALKPWAVVRTITQAGNGDLWFGTMRDGLRRLTANGEVTRYALEQGLSSVAVRDLHLDERGHLWVATEDHGLCRSRPRAGASEPRFDCLGETEGLHSASLHRILADDQGRLWLNSNSGVFWVERSELDRVLAGAVPRVYPRVYTERDGVPDREGNGGVQGAGLRLADGRLAFPGQGGIAIFDPRRVRAESVSARVAIESLVLPGGREIVARPELELPLDERVFSVRFAGLTPGLTDPLYFRFRLRPSREEWTEIGSDRLLSFERLPPGRHELEVVAIDAASGTAGPVARMRLHLPAHVYETATFRFGLLAAVAVLASIAVWRRVTRAAAHRRRLELEVDRRTAELRTQQQATEEALATVSRQGREIEALAEARTRFFANVNHELRTPLTLLLGPLLEQRDGVAPTTERNEAMVRNARRLERLVEQLLDLERLDAGRLPSRPVAVDLAGVVRESVRAFAELAERSQLEIDAALDDEPVPVRVDVDQIGRVLGNLLSNAVKFTPPGGRIRVTLRAIPGRAELAVEDTGPGVPAAWRERIFDRFSQMENRETQASEGAGLGLALSREIVRLHHGSLHAESAAAGGARFVLRLPLNVTADEELSAASARAPAGPPNSATTPQASETAAAAAAEAAVCDALRVAAETSAAGATEMATPPDDATVPASETDRYRVLIAEDNPDLCRYIREILADDYDTQAVEDGEAALDAARREPPDAIVSDIVMPRRDGFQLARALRADAELAGVPLIFLTARAGDADRIAGLRIGADQYLRKPFRGEVLKAHVAAALHTCRRLRDQLARRATESVPDLERARPRLRGGGGGTGSVPESFVGRVRAWIETHVHDETLTVEAVAAAFNMSRITLYRKLVADAGETPVDLIRDVRLSRARRLLREAAGNVSEVAYAVGFNSLSAFSRAYRARYGEPPSQGT